MSKKGYTRTINTPDGYVQQPDGRAILYNQTYVGFVKDNADPDRMGKLKVWIPELGSDPNNASTWHTVNYCSPFAGATPVKYTTKDGQKYTDSQRSYGFWAVPPDVDNEVIVQFINGDPNRGIWIGCLYQQFMNHMVPGIPRNYTFSEDDQYPCPPVVEYNKNSNIGNDDDPLRPSFDPLYEGLKLQGLANDPERGPASSGARREDISKVFGMLTPEGSQFVMDDLECNQLIRLRTKSGVQILIHETKGYIYMNSKKGNSWLQISDDGIEMYSSKAVNVRSQGGYNFHTDKDYTMHIGGNFNIFTEGSFKVSTKDNVDFLAGKDMRQDIGGSFHSTIKKNRAVKIEGSDNLTADGIVYKSATLTAIDGGRLITLKAARINQNGGAEPPVPSLPVSAEGAKPEKTDDIKLEKDYPSDKRNSITNIMPTHEPYVNHPIEDNGKNDEQSMENNNPNIDPSTIPEGVEPHPLDGKGRVSSQYGMRNHPVKGGRKMHWGIDLAAPAGTPVRSMTTGVVHNVNNYGDVTVKNSDGSTRTYRHINSNVSKGQTIQAGAMIGSLRRYDPRSTGPHLHLEATNSAGQRINPTQFITNSKPMSSFYDPSISSESASSELSLSNNIYDLNPYIEETNKSSLEKQENIMERSIVKVFTENSIGTGVVVDNSGSMYTNAHVVGFDATVGQRFKIQANGVNRWATLIQINQTRDVARLNIDTYTDLIPFSFGSSVQTGDKLFTYGYASTGLTKIEAKYTGESNKATIYPGNSGTSKDGNKVYGLSVMDIISTNNILPGMSGGPVLNENGQLVGINAAATVGDNTAKFVQI